MSEPFGAVVVGLGGMGSAAACHLARAGVRVVGVDRFHPPHEYGSSHGQSRVIRQAYFEGPVYVPLVLRAYELWAKLESDSGQRLLTETGGLMIGSRASNVVRGSIHSAQVHHLDHLVYGYDELKARFPQFAFDPDCVGLYEKKAGVLVPEVCIEAHLELAARSGASLRADEPLTLIRGIGTHKPLEVITTRQRFETERILLCGGAWTPEFLPDLPIPLTVERQIMHWFEPEGDFKSFCPSRFPVFVWDHGNGIVAYGIPAIHGPGRGVKFAFHSLSGERCTPDTLSRTVPHEKIEQARSYLKRYVPSLAATHLRSAACMYTMTPDHHFVIDFLPEDPRVIVAAGFSGHGFKFASVVGEILAELALKGASRWDLSAFRLARRFDGAVP